MTSRAILFFLAILTLHCLPAAAQVEEVDAVAAARAAAKEWLAIVDAGRYGESWDEAGSMFKAGVAKAAWESTVGPTRKPLGATKTREVKSAQFLRTLPNAPEGAYVRIAYDSSFEKLPAATETLAMMREKDGKWRAIGYFIRPAPLPGPASETSDEKLRELLKDRIDVAKRGVGIVMGILDEKGRRVMAYGRPNGESNATVDADTVFEIGSITKVFTGLILADMLERGEVALDDPVSLYLPASVKVPRNGGGEITLRQLATHTSGLPRMPANFSPADPANPYADYGTERMFEFIAASHPKDSAPGMADYSNLGFGLLGVALANRAGTDYATLLQARVLDPLGMKDTAILVKGDMARRRATGHSPDLRPVSAWDFDAFAGAGAIRSTMNDLLKFAAAELGLVSTPLDAAMRASQQPAGSAGRQGLAWIILLEGERLTHSGMTGGFASEMILDVKRKKAVVVLSNAQVSNFDIALHAMDSRNPVVSR